MHWDAELSEISAGEEYIAEYVDAIEIEYRKQHVIEGLDDKYASYRVAVTGQNNTGLK